MVIPILNFIYVFDADWKFRNYDHVLVQKRYVFIPVCRFRFSLTAKYSLSMCTCYHFFIFKNAISNCLVFVDDLGIDY